MDKKKIFKENGLYFYNTLDFATIKICFNFRIDRDIESIIKARVMSGYLERTSKNYQTFKEIRNKLRYFYNMDVKIYQTYYGSENFLNFSVEMVSPRIIGGDYMKDAITFVKEMLLNPNFNDGKLDEEVLTRVKKDLISFEERNTANPSVIKERILLSNINPDSNVALNKIIDVTMYERIVNSITDKDLIEFYNETIKNFYKGYVFGDVNSDERKIITSSFPFESKEDVLDYREFLTIRDGEEEVIYDTKQSDLYVVYKLDNYNLDKLHIYKTLSRMLSGRNGLCHKVLRSELGLVYSSGAFINKYRMYGFMFLNASISEENKEKCLDGIDEIFKRLKDKSVVSELLQYAKDKLNQEYYLSDEDVYNVIDDFDCYVFGTFPDKEELYKKINELSSDDIINEVDNISKKYVFFGRGVRK